MSENIPETKHHPQPEPRKRGDGNIYPRKGIWWIRYSFRGDPMRESSHSSNPEDAWKLLKRRMKEVWADRQGLQTFIQRADKVRISELLDDLEKDYKLKHGQVSKQTRAHLKPIRETFGDMRAVALTPKHVDDYINRRLEKDQMAPATVNKETGILSRAFKLGRQREEIIAHPIFAGCRKTTFAKASLRVRSLRRSLRHCPNTSRTSRVSPISAPGEEVR
jgi:hypothetical protein